VKTINAHNANSSSSFLMKTNQFSDLTPAEFNDRFLGFKASASSDVHLGEHEWQGENLPEDVDWVTSGAVTPVKNQGGCGSCWAFSTTGSLEGAIQLATGELVVLAEQQLVDCDGPVNRGCQGGSMDIGLRYAKDHDFCKEESYPYEAKNGDCRASSCTSVVKKGLITGVKEIGIPMLVPASEQALQSAVAHQPVSVGVDAAKFQNYASGTFEVGDCGTKLDHGVLVVGYGTDNGTEAGKYWKVKNSWGPAWGMDGYVKLRRGVGGKGTCGVLVNPSYPVTGGVSITV